MNTTIVPAACDLDAWSRLQWRDGLQLATVRALDTLRVRTKNSLYEVTVVDPLRGEILVRGGKFFPVYTRAQLAGASLSGSFLKALGIYVGFSMEIQSDEGVLVTTRVREVAVMTPSPIPYLG